MKTRNRILFINMFFEPSIAATAQHLSDLARHLAAHGWSVEVLCSNRLYEDASAKLPLSERAGGISVNRLPLLFFSRSGFLRALGYLEFLARVFFHVLVRRKPDICVTMTTPPFLLLPGAVLKLRGSRHVHWSLDLYPEVARAFGTLGILSARVMALLRNVLLRFCDRIVALGTVMGERIVWLGFPARKLRVVPPWSPYECADSGPPLGEFVLLYSGNIGKVHEFTTALRAARKLPDVHFAFVGGGAKRGEIERAAGELPNVSLRDPVPREEVGKLFASASAQLVTLDPRADGLLVPSKMFGAMASGRPVVLVASARNELARELEEGKPACRQAGFGFRIEPGDVDGFVGAVRTLVDDPDLGRKMGQRAHVAFLHRHELSVCAEAFAEVLGELVQGPYGTRQAH